MRLLPLMTGLCLLATALPVTAAPTLVVQTASGKIEGATKDGVERFLGVPFAKPPVGPLRWRAPQTPVPWQGVRPATSYGPDCVQDAMIEPPGPGWVNPVNEDCLYLNVWRPAHAHKRPLPVMVWIYGGAFIMGAGSFPPYDGTAFARQDVILVNFNYRLGRFGTFAHPALMQEQAGQPAGNYGVLDQIAALNWVRDNIAAFGGDPNNVTIFGESAGASSVNFLMASPLARGLFNKAISQSGGSGANLKSLDAMETEAKIWAASKGVKDDNAVALRALTTAQVLDSPETQVASPFIDGKIITQSTDTAFATGAVAKVPYLVGSNGYEESLLRWLPGGEKGLLAKPGADAVLKLYMSTGLDQVAAGKKMWGDAAMTLPAHTRAAEMAAAGQKVWLYRYSYVPESLRSTLPGAGHEAEIEMVFATQHGRIPHIWSPGDKTMAATVHRYWVNFARVGDPNGEGDPGLRQWPAVTSSENTLMDFANGGAQVVHDFDQPRLDALKAMLDTH